VYQPEYTGVAMKESVLILFLLTAFTVNAFSAKVFSDESWSAPSAQMAEKH
jgi:hypothetical protein